MRFLSTCAPLFAPTGFGYTRRVTSKHHKPSLAVAGPQRNEEIDSGLAEAMERYERDLPLSKEHVARLLMVSARTVERQLTATGRTARGGIVWYSREEVDAIWRRNSDRRKEGIASRRRRGGSSRSSIGEFAASSSMFRSPATAESGRPLVERVEKMLGGAPLTLSKMPSED